MPTIPTILGQDPWPVSGPAPVDIDSQQDRGTALKDTPSPAVLSDSSLSQYIFVGLRHEVEVANHVLSFNRNRMQQADDAIDVLFYLGHLPTTNYNCQLAATEWALIAPWSAVARVPGSTQVQVLLTSFVGAVDRVCCAYCCCLLRCCFFCCHERPTTYGG